MSKAKEKDRSRHLAVLKDFTSIVARGPAEGDFREDEPRPSLDREALLQNAAGRDNVYFKLSGRGYS